MVVVVGVVDVVATIMTRFISLLKATLKDYVSHSNDHPPGVTVMVRGWLMKWKFKESYPMVNLTRQP